MPKPPLRQAPSDVCLLLRADAEQCWLHREVIPVLRELEAQDALVEEQACVALAYLEAMWSEATIRARATDAAHGELRCADEAGDRGLSGEAGRYHAAVRVLRELIAARINDFTEVGTPSDERYRDTQDVLAEAPGGGFAPRAA
jgi:hypothetical protein